MPGCKFTTQVRLTLHLLSLKKFVMNKQIYRLAPAIAIGTIALSSAVAYLYLKFIPAREAANPLASAQVIPEQAIGAGFITTDPEVRAKVDRVINQQAQTQIMNGFQGTQVFQQYLADRGIDYQKDLQPWIGSVTFAPLPSDPSTGSAQPNLLLVIGIKDKLAALDFAHKHWNKPDLNLKNQKYKGVDLVEIKDDQGQGFFYVGVLNNHLVISQSKRTIEQSIDAAQSSQSLATKLRKSKVLARTANVGTPIAQFFTPDAPYTLKQLSQSNPEMPSPPENLLQMKNWVLSVGVDDIGLQLKLASEVDPEQFKWEFKPIPGKVVTQFPKDTFLLTTGYNAPRQFFTFVEQLKATPEVEQTVAQIKAQFWQATGLDLEKDVLGWMDGEFAFGLIPTPDSSLLSGIGGAFIVSTSDRSRAETTVNRLNSWVAQNGVPIHQQQLGGTTVSEWQIPGRGTLLGHGWLNQNTFMIAADGSVAEEIATRQASNLSQDEIFRAVTKSLPQHNSGYTYINVEKVRSLVTNSDQAANFHSFNPEVQAVLNSIRGLGMTTTRPEPTVVETDMVVALNPIGN